MMIEGGYEEMIALDDTSQTRHETIADFLGVDAGGAPGDLEHCLDRGCGDVMVALQETDMYTNSTTNTTCNVQIFIGALLK